MRRAAPVLDGRSASGTGAAMRGNASLRSENEHTRIATALASAFSAPPASISAGYDAQHKKYWPNLHTIRNTNQRSLLKVSRR